MQHFIGKKHRQSFRSRCRSLLSLSQCVAVDRNIDIEKTLPIYLCIIKVKWQFHFCMEWISPSVRVMLSLSQLQSINLVKKPHTKSLTKYTEHQRFEIFSRFKVQGSRFVLRDSKVLYLFSSKAVVPKRFSPWPKREIWQFAQNPN